MIRRSNRKKSVRTRFRRLVVIPSAMLLTLWLIGSTYTGLQAYKVWAVGSAVQQASIPAVNLLTALQKERLETMRALSTPGEATTLATQRVRTDAALATLQTKLATVSNHAPQTIKDQTAKFASLLRQLPDHRAALAAGATAKDAIFAYYNNVMDAGADLFETQARAVSDAAAGEQGLTATELFRDADRLSRAASLGDAALVAGAWGPGDHLAFAGLVGAYHTSLHATLPFAQPDVQSAYQQLSDSPAYGQLVEDENRLVERTSADPPPSPGRAAFTVSEAQWQTATDQVSDQLLGLATHEAADGAALGVADGTDGLVQAAAIDGVAFLVIAASVWLVWRHSRRLVARLAGLRSDVLRFRQETLPTLMARSQAGEDVDLAAEFVQEHGADELADVAAAFNHTAHTAGQAVVGLNHTQRGFAQLLYGLAMRINRLMQQQLAGISELEKQAPPGQLASLFTLDHQAALSRRHAENAIILAGEKPGRQWHQPVRLVDVIRSAVSESENYQRIDVRNVPAVHLVGAAVGDTIHLLAELLENATTYSSPRLPVEVHATSMRSDGGVLIEIVDQGLGFKATDREWAQAMLAGTPTFDEILRNPGRRGLFVVATLAARQRIEVTFNQPATGGTVTLVMLPPSLLSTQPPAEDTTARKTIDVDDATQPPDSSPALHGRLTIADLQKSLPAATETTSAIPPVQETHTTPPSNGAGALPKRTPQQHLPRRPQRNGTHPDQPPPRQDLSQQHLGAFQRGTQQARGDYPATDQRNDPSNDRKAW